MRIFEKLSPVSNCGGGTQQCYNIYMKRPRAKFLFSVTSLILFAIFVTPTITHAATSGYAWSENVGWIDFSGTAGAVTVTDSTLSGYAYGENIGWIVLTGVTNSGGTLSGYAWGENVGWIDFAPTAGGVVINTSTGVFSGYAYGENIGWINFDTGAIAVTTSWRPPTVTLPVSPPSTSSHSSSGGRASTATLIALGLLPANTPTNPPVPGCPSGMVCRPKVSTPSTTPSFTAPALQHDSVGQAPIITPKTFTRTLTVGDKGNDVKILQQYLNTHGFIISNSGAGSPGNETTTFGGLTRQALIKFQKDSGIRPAVGLFGPVTRAFISSH